MIRGFFVWTAVAAALVVPIAAAAMSPLLAWRDAIYITAGFAGVAGMALLLLQPLLAAGLLPGLQGLRGRRVHRWTGATLVTAVVLHVAGLWITSPPDVIDALTFTSPTPFSAWGVVSMWALFASAALATFWRKLGLTPRRWRMGHKVLAGVIVLGSVVHAMLIDGTMEVLSKTVLCCLVVVATITALSGKTSRW